MRAGFRCASQGLRGPSEGRVTISCDPLRARMVASAINTKSEFEDGRPYDGAVNPELIPHTIVSLVALGMGLAFLSADRHSPSSRWLASTLGFVGISIYFNIILITDVESLKDLSGWFAVPETVAMVAMLEWLLRVRHTVPARPGMNVTFGDRVLRIGQVSAVLYCVLAVLYPLRRSEEFLGALTSVEALSRPGFWMFCTPVLVSMLTGLGAILLLLNRKPDLAERLRVVAFAFSVPFFAASFVLPLQASALAMVLGEIILLIGAVHYHVLQGQRGQFMSRFLSPQVARLVSDRGLAAAMQESHLEITVVCCDLRGFTAYAQAHPSERVLKILRQYYDAVGHIAGEYGATIKDFAGDGVLILVGAPLPVENHARVGLEIARRIRDACRSLTALWSSADHRLGIGVGVASGMVTVGVIGSATRLEYTAVGSTVNLASRLCEQAQHAEILVDRRTAELAGDGGLAARAPLGVKGFSGPVPHFALTA
jgi:adenylate cyclase